MKISLVNFFYLDNLSFLVFKNFLFQSFVSILVTDLKYLFIWDSSFWLTLFWVCSLEFPSTGFVSTRSGAVFNVEIPKWLLLDIKLLFPFCFGLSHENWIFSHCVGSKAFQCKLVGRKVFSDSQTYILFLFICFIVSF